MLNRDRAALFCLSQELTVRGRGLFFNHSIAKALVSLTFARIEIGVR